MDNTTFVTVFFKRQIATFQQECTTFTRGIRTYDYPIAIYNYYVAVRTCVEEWSTSQLRRMSSVDQKWQGCTRAQTHLHTRGLLTKKEDLSIISL